MMGLIVTLLLFFIGFTNGLNITYYPCASTYGQVDNVNCEPCTKVDNYKCAFQQGNVEKIEIIFTPNKDISSGKMYVTAFLGPIPMPFDLSDANVCENSLTCPLKAHTQYRHTITIPINFPAIKLIVQIEMKDDSNNVVLCFKSPVIVIPNANQTSNGSLSGMYMPSNFGTIPQSGGMPSNKNNGFPPAGSFVPNPVEAKQPNPMNGIPFSITSTTTSPFDVKPLSNPNETPIIISSGTSNIENTNSSTTSMYEFSSENIFNSSHLNSTLATNSSFDFDKDDIRNDNIDQSHVHDYDFLNDNPYVVNTTTSNMTTFTFTQNPIGNQSALAPSNQNGEK